MTSRPRTRLLIVTLAAALVAVDVILPGLLRTPSPGRALPLRQAGELALPGGSTRFDYESLDPGRGLLFIAHLGDSQVIETSYYPVPDGPGGHPALLTYQPAP